MPSSPSLPELSPLLAPIAGHAAEVPELRALICEGETVSYGALWAGAVAVAERLIAAGHTPGDRVAFDADRVPQTYLNLLGILVAGGSYVALSDKAPPARHAVILADSGARFRLTGETIAPLGGEPLNSREPGGYILYTSGSTGVPKGVQITFDNLIGYFAGVEAFYPVARGDRASQVLDLSFDVSVEEIFHAWRAGATLCVVPTRHVLMWPRYFRDFGIVEAKLIPSQVRLAAHAGLLKPGLIPTLRRIVLGGEAVTGAVIRLMREVAPNVQPIVEWGPTESTIYFSHYKADEVLPDHEIYPIGRPWPGEQILLDGDDDGVGEMLVAGKLICRGYLNLPQANAERFVWIDGLRYYRTGDLGRYDPERGYIFCGRRDRQVKVKGIRIELDECEKVIRKHARSDRAYVLADGDDLLCAVGTDIDIDALDAAVRRELPIYMVPSRFVAVENFPFIVSGKIDLRRLREIVTV